MKNTDQQNPLDAVSHSCCDYKTARFGMFHPERTDEQKEKYLSAATEYKKALKSAIQYLRDDLKSLEKEMLNFGG